MKRCPTPELLDADFGTAQEVAASLRDLESFNDRLGGVATTREMVKAVAQGADKTSLSMLEVAAGTGFVPRAAAQELWQMGIQLNTTLLDRAATHLPGSGVGEKLVADALKLPFADSTYDLVSCSLFLHHLSPDEIVQFARESLRVARVALVVNDLKRNWVHLGLAYAGVPLYRSRITRHDAPASVRQAYTVAEVKELLLRGGASKIDIQTHYLFRMGLIAWK